jgi:hypothetical protein
VDCVSEGIKDCGNVPIDAIMVMPNVGHRQGDVFSKGSGSIDSDTFGVFAQVSPTGPAIAAASAYDVSLSGDDITREEVFDVRTDLDDRADEFVADDHRNGDCFLSPGVPVVNVQIGSADSGFLNFDQAIVDSDLRKWDILKFESYVSAMFHQCFHVTCRHLSVRVVGGEW